MIMDAGNIEQNSSFQQGHQSLNMQRQQKHHLFNPETLYANAAASGRHGMSQQPQAGSALGGNAATTAAASPSLPASAAGTASDSARSDLSAALAANQRYGELLAYASGAGGQAGGASAAGAMAAAGGNANGFFPSDDMLMYQYARDAALNQLQQQQVAQQQQAQQQQQIQQSQAAAAAGMYNPYLDNAALLARREAAALAAAAELNATSAGAMSRVGAAAANPSAADLSSLYGPGAGGSASFSSLLRGAGTAGGVVPGVMSQGAGSLDGRGINGLNTVPSKLGSSAPSLPPVPAGLMSPAVSAAASSSPPLRSAATSDLLTMAAAAAGHTLPLGAGGLGGMSAMGLGGAGGIGAGGGGMLDLSPAIVAAAQRGGGGRGGGAGGRGGKGHRTRKPKGMPKRPLSAYNIYFKEERARILESIPSPPGYEEDEAEASADKSEKDGDDAADAKGGGKQKVKNRPHGKIGFENLAKIIGQSWKALPADRVSHYKGLADEDMKRYKAEMEAWHEKEVLKKKVEAGGQGDGADDAQSHGLKSDDDRSLDEGAGSLRGRGQGGEKKKRRLSGGVAVPDCHISNSSDNDRDKAASNDMVIGLAEGGSFSLASAGSRKRRPVDDELARKASPQVNVIDEPDDVVNALECRSYLRRFKFPKSED